MKYVTICLTALICLSTSSSAQGQVDKAFDISSVKPARDNSASGSIRRLDQGIVSVLSMTVSDMIELFFYVKPYQIWGGPDWMKRERFDVIGKDSTVGATEEKPSATAIEDDNEKMLGLLKDRFRLKLHHESKKLPTLLLVADKKKRLSAVPCSSAYRLQHGEVKGAIHTASLAALLKVEMGMPVRDDTGLTQCYEMDARWTTDPSDDRLPSVPAMLHELGFRLEKAKSDVDVLVIDQLERPRPD